jgi:hypothetical protein
MKKETSLTYRISNFITWNHQSIILLQLIDWNSKEKRRSRSILGLVDLKAIFFFLPMVK